MLFNSWQFVMFFLIVFFLYYLIPHKHRWVMLLVASYYFYMCWKPELVVLILIATTVNYFAAIGIENMAENGKRGKRCLLLIGSLVISLGILFFYKYFDFFSVSLGEVLHSFSIHFDPVVLNLVLPMGISFYTFQTLSYTIDVYKGRTGAEKHFGYFALYISFFPQLVAGPIERSDSLLPQLKQEHKFDYENAIYGLKQMSIGFFKKIVVADTLAKGVNTIYNNVEAHSGLLLVAATVMFAFQIYCDFSGYSDIAVGCAKTMGIDLMQNFKSPYLSRSIREFWSRWHISLSTWFRDYVYIPLGGNRVSVPRSYLNLMITFLLSGLWHGAAWTFVIWGGLHGLYQISEKAIAKLIHKKKKRFSNVFYVGMKNFIAIATTFFFVCFAWIFFRANTITDAVYIIRHMFEGISNPIAYLKTGIIGLDISKLGMAILSFELLVLVIIDLAQTKIDVIKKISTLALPVRWGIYLAFCIMVVALSTKGTAAEFIYFQF